MNTWSITGYGGITRFFGDLKEYDFPLFDERLQFQESPSQKMLDFSEKIKAADGVLVVTPEYNGGYPASLKNVIDLLHPEWKR